MSKKFKHITVPEAQPKNTVRIAVYGDSWGDPSVGDPELRELAWPNLLTTLIDGSEVTVYNQGGSSLWYSYDLFARTHKDYDHVIFVETTDCRWYEPIRAQQGQRWTCTNAATLDTSRKQIVEQGLMTHEVATYIDAIKSWYLDLLDYDHDHTVNQLLLAEIHRVRPDVLHIPQEFIRLWSLTLYNSMGSHILDGIGRCWNSGQNPERKLTCHWPVEYNRVLAEHLARSIREGCLTLPPTDVFIPLPHTWEYYWRV